MTQFPCFFNRPLFYSFLTFSRHYLYQLGSDKIEQRLARMEKEGGETKVKLEGDGKDKEKEKGEPKEKESADDPQFVKDLLSLHDKFINVVNREFCGNALFQKALKDAFVEVSDSDVILILTSSCDDK